MTKTHVTKEGLKMSIFEMENSHLLATINLFCGNITKLRESLDNPKELKKSEKVLYGADVMDERECADRLSSLTDKLGAYVFEAAIRGFDVSKPLQVAYGRDGSVKINQGIDF